MHTKFKVFFFLSLFPFACNKTKDYNPDSYLTAKEKDAVHTLILRYVVKSPDGVSPSDIFKPSNDKYYQEKAKTCFLEAYTTQDDYFYFLISQPAPSLTEKRHATAGRFKLNDKGELTEYEEMFRTWKMIPADVKTKSLFLFDLLVKGESLEPYHSKNKGDQYIEFPDDRTYYDKSDRSWKTKSSSN